MPQPSNFISTTDFPTMKNDAGGTGVGTVAGSLVVPGASRVSGSGIITVGAIGSLARGKIAAAKNNNNFYIGQNINFTRNGTVLGISAGYSVFCFMYRSSPTTITFTIFVENPYADPLVCEAVGETISFNVSTFIPPYA